MVTRDMLSYLNTCTRTHTTKSHYANGVDHAEATAAPLAAVRHTCVNGVNIKSECLLRGVCINMTSVI